MNDEYIINLFCREDGTLIANKFHKKFLDSNKDIANYLQNRFPEDEFISYSYVVERIRDKIEELPVCRTCGKKLLNYRNKYCSRICQNRNPEHNEKIRIKTDATKNNNPEEWLKKKSEAGRKTWEARRKHAEDDPEWYKETVDKMNRTRNKTYEEHPEILKNSKIKMKKTVETKKKENPDLYKKEHSVKLIVICKNYLKMFNL